MLGIVYQKDDYKIINILYDIKSYTNEMLIDINNNQITIDISMLNIIVTEQLYNIGDILSLDVELDSLKQYKLYLISEQCNEDILNGFTSNAKDGQTIEHYNFTYDDQINMSGIQSKIFKALLLTGSFSGIIEWKNSDQIECDNNWTLQQYIQLCNDAENFKTEKIKKCHRIKQLISTIIVKSDLEVISWSMDI